MNPKRRFFQIHLSTAVVLMLVAGVLVWANVRERVLINRPAHWRPSDWGRAVLIQEEKVIYYGWPFSNRAWIHAGESAHTWFPEEVCIDAAISLAILLSVCVVCEWRIRRRAARKAVE